MNTLGGFWVEVWQDWVTTIEATKYEPQREVPGAIAPPRLTHHRTTYPGGGASNVVMAVAVLFVGLLDLPTIPETEQRRKASLGYARNLDSGITVAVPHMTLEGFFRPPSLGVIHFSFARLKIIRSCRRRAHSSANLRSRVRASLFVGWLLCEAARSSRLFRVLSIYWQLVRRCPVRQKPVFFRNRTKIRLSEDLYFQIAFTVTMGPWDSQIRYCCERLRGVHYTTTAWSYIYSEIRLDHLKRSTKWVVWATPQIVSDQRGSTRAILAEKMSSTINRVCRRIL